MSGLRVVGVVAAVDDDDEAEDACGEEEVACGGESQEGEAAGVRGWLWRHEEDAAGSCEGEGGSAGDEDAGGAEAHEEGLGAGPCEDCHEQNFDCSDDVLIGNLFHISQLIVIYRKVGTCKRE